MKSSHLKYGFFLLLFGFISFNSISQIADENTYVINQYFQLNKDASLGAEKNASKSSIQSQINVVTLNQIGNNNEIDIKQKSSDSQSVSQIGDSNYYNFINYYNSTPSNFNILQQGKSNSLQIYGENSIIKNISIVQNSNFKTLIIKNY
ncbi:hypothetical protein [uncultured Lutibacter sp.]|uniref:hypothetical protein n=1 Tax=uncultured Lutibacter sp. TaxID=437739 RepID=UPI002636679E|nr:hypothetical protein [uncultured Lutibacter sp.]